MDEPGEPGDVRVLVVDDDQVVQRVVAVMLECSEGLALAGQALDGRSALQWVSERRADVVLLDFDLPDTDATHLVPRLRAADPSLPLLLHSGRDDVAAWGDRLRTEGAITKSGDWCQVASMLQRLGQQRLRTGQASVEAASRD